MKLDGKVAIVSGGGTGIGAATARLFAREGASVVVTGRRSGPIEAVAEEISGVAVAGDTSDPAHDAEAVAVAVRTFGGLDVVVTNAGIGLGGSAAEVTEEQWRTTIDVNLTGQLFLTRRGAPPVARARGRVDRRGVVGLRAGRGQRERGLRGVESRPARLGALPGRQLRTAGHPREHRIPGSIHTPWPTRPWTKTTARDGLTREGAYLAATAEAPLRRAGEPEEIAACCAFLASDESSFVTGQSLIADGGSTVVDVASLVFAPDRWDPAP